MPGHYCIPLDSNWHTFSFESILALPLKRKYATCSAANVPRCEHLHQHLVSVCMRAIVRFRFHQTGKSRIDLLYAKRSALERQAGVVCVTI
jgi:hypothetical protein